MPFIKREIPFAKMQRLLRGYGLNGPKLGDVLGCSPTTARVRLNSPETLTLGELERISTHAHIAWQEILDAAHK